MIREQMQLILDNRINGNYSDYHKLLRKMTKLQLVKFINFAVSSGNDVKYHNILIDIQNALSK